MMCCHVKQAKIWDWMEPCVVKRLRKENVGQSIARPLKGLTCLFFQREREEEGAVEGVVRSRWDVLMHKQSHESQIYLQCV